MNDFPPVENNAFNIYNFSYYWIFEVFTTVGYGDYSGGTSIEYLYSILLEFIGIIINSFFIGIAGDFVSQSTGFDALISHQLDRLDLWVKKIEKSNTPFHLKPQLYANI